MERIAKIYGKEYGTDWVFLGYKEGKELVVKNIGQNIHQQFPSDHLKTPIAEIPLMKDLRQAKDFPLITSISAGSPGLTEYVLQIQGQYNLNIVGACTAVIGPDTIPFHKSALRVIHGMPDRRSTRNWSGRGIRRMGSNYWPRSRWMSSTLGTFTSLS